MPELAPRELHVRLRAKFGEAIADLPETGEATAVVVATASIVDVCRWLRDEPGLDFDCLTNLSGVDYPKRQVIQLVYHLYSYTHLRLVVLKADLPRDDPQAPSVEGVWPTANWMEREIYDLLGVSFTGHSDLRRILMPEDWVGHPLRKDFVEPEDYHGIPTRRESLLRP
jgi:NADH-quinone oxidoreductase subunit C